MQAERFAPHQALAAKLLPAVQDGSDGAHDRSHLVRVWRNAELIASAEGGDGEILAAAVLLHDCVHVPKNSPLRKEAARLAADEARVLLKALAWEPSRIEEVATAVESHSFSGGIEPTTLEGCILQDADRLDAIGATGIARCFYTAGRLGSRLYDPDDPAAHKRGLDDIQNALDHFPKKLLTLAEGFKTGKGRELARERHRQLLAFYRGMLSEICD